MEHPLSGKRIAVLVDHKFIPEEIAAYRTVFPAYGAEVHFMSRLWYGDYHPERTTFLSDVDPLDGQPWDVPERLEVSHEVTQARLEDYAAVLMSANYTSVRLRFFDPSEKDERGRSRAPGQAEPGETRVPGQAEPGGTRALVQSSPAVRFFARAMADQRIVKGALCHGLWILTPFPELLRGRRVICHAVVMSDVLNCGAEIVDDPSGVVVDGDLVTGRSKNEVSRYVETVAERILVQATVGGAR